MDVIESVNLPQLHPAAPRITDMKDFLNTSASHLETTPNKSSPDYSILLLVLCMALRQEVDIQLRYEAVHILVQSAVLPELSRRDTVTCHALLQDMLKNGSETDKDTAAQAFCKLGMMDQNVLERLLTGLGDVQRARRAHLNSLLSKVDLKFVPYILPRLFDEFDSINYKVRIDIIQHLENFMNRIRVEMGIIYLGAVEQEAQSYMSFPNSLSKLAEMNEEYRKHKQQKLQGNQEEQRIGPELSLATTVDGHPLDEFNLNELLEGCLNVLVTAMWQDTSSEVQKIASEALGRLGGGRVIFNQIISLLESEDTAKRIEALKCLAYVGVLTKPALKSVLKCFPDSIAAVRIEACKVACVLKSHEPSLLQALSERLKDFDWKVRAYAVKGLGLSNLKAPKLRAALIWHLVNDPSPIVRTETIHAFTNLGYFPEDPTIRDWFITLLQRDESDIVKAETERLLVEAGVILPSNSHDESLGSSISGYPKKGIDLARIPASLSLPYPHILSGKSQDEIEIFLRESLIEDKEAQDVIDQVRSMATKDKVLEQVNFQDRHSGKLPKLQVDLNLGSEKFYSDYEDQTQFRQKLSGKFLQMRDRHRKWRKERIPLATS